MEKMTPLQQAVTNIIGKWENQKKSCDKFFPTTQEYALAYSNLIGLRQALDELRFAGLVTYNNGKWELDNNQENLDA